MMSTIKRQRRWLIGILVAVTGVLALFAGQWTDNNIKMMESRQRSAMSPVIMIPGSSATVNRFDPLVRKLNQVDHRNHSLLKVKVYDDGRITYTGQIRPRDREVGGQRS